MKEQNFVQTIKTDYIKHPWFSRRIGACHAIDPISIRVRGKSEKLKHFAGKAQTKFLQFFTVPLSKRRKLLKYSAEFNLN